MSKVFVVDTNKHPLNPVHPGRARILLDSGKAAIYKRFPFTIILKTPIQDPEVAELRIKIDPGSRTTGIAIVNDRSGQVVFAAELSHRGQSIKSSLDHRRAVRRSRRARHTRYRKAKFDNRRGHSSGWLPPSQTSRIANVITWIRRLMRVCYITQISMELVKFDTAAMENPEISGVEYQQGTLAGYEVRQYLLEKWNHSCTYCGKQNLPLQIEHIHPRAKGGSNRVSNLCLACEACNIAKGTQDIREFLAKKPDLLACILAQAKSPLKDATAVNATRWQLYRRLQALGLSMECATGGRTKYNRMIRELPKTHWIDAVCVGASTPEDIQADGVVPLLITSNGHGCRQMCGTNKYGFPCRHRQRQKSYFGFQTGDMVRAVVTTGKKAGIYTGRVLVRASGSFDIVTTHRRVTGISHRYCSAIHQRDGYSYRSGGRHSSPA